MTRGKRWWKICVRFSRRVYRPRLLVRPLARSYAREERREKSRDDPRTTEEREEGRAHARWPCSRLVRHRETFKNIRERERGHFEKTRRDLRKVGIYINEVERTTNSLVCAVFDIKDDIGAHRWLLSLSCSDFDTLYSNLWQTRILRTKAPEIERIDGWSDNEIPRWPFCSVTCNISISHGKNIELFFSYKFFWIYAMFSKKVKVSIFEHVPNSGHSYGLGLFKYDYLIKLSYIIVYFILKV